MVETSTLSYMELTGFQRGVVFPSLWLRAGVMFSGGPEVRPIIEGISSNVAQTPAWT